MKTTHTLSAHIIILLGSALHIVSAKPAKTAEWKQKPAAFQQTNKAAERKPEQP